MSIPSTHLADLCRNQTMTLWSAASIPRNICLHLEPPLLQHAVTHLAEAQRGGITLPYSQGRETAGLAPES